MTECVTSAPTNTLLSRFIKFVSHLAFAPIASIIVDTHSIFAKRGHVQTLVHIYKTGNRKSTLSLTETVNHQPRPQARVATVS